MQRENNTLKLLLKEQYQINLELEALVDKETNKVLELKRKIKEMNKEKNNYDKKTK